MNLLWPELPNLTARTSYKAEEYNNTTGGDPAASQLAVKTSMPTWKRYVPWWLFTIDTQGDDCCSLKLAIRRKCDAPRASY